MVSSPDETVDLVAEAVRAAGIRATPRPNDGAVDLIIHIGGVSRRIELQVMSTVTPTSWRGQSTNPSPNDEGLIRLVVADRVVGAARDLLRARGQSWLDLRGHLYLTGPGVLVDVPVPATAKVPSPPRNPLRGSVALTIACELLIEPGKERAVRELARTLKHAPSSVSTAMADLRDAHLVTARGAPVIPQLFWETVAAWKPASTDLATISIIDNDPAVAGALKVGKDDPEALGWALTDSLAAAAYGAPAGVRADYPPEFYVPDAATARRAETLLGTPTSKATRGATIKIAPVPQVCTRRVPRSTGGWPLAHPLYVALDLAVDPARGTEILETWHPSNGFHRVW